MFVFQNFKNTYCVFGCEKKSLTFVFYCSRVLKMILFFCLYREREWCMRLVYQEFYQRWYLLQNTIIWLIGLHHILVTNSYHPVLIMGSLGILLSSSIAPMNCVFLHMEWKMCNQIVCLSLSRVVNRKRCIVNEVSLSITHRLSPADRRKLFCIFPCCADGVYRLIEIRASLNFNSKRVSGLYFFSF